MIKQFPFFVCSTMNNFDVVTKVALLITMISLSLNFFISVKILREFKKIQEDIYLILNPECPYYEGLTPHKEKK